MKTVISVKVDKDVKVHAQELAREFGISLSAIINAHLKQLVRDEKLLFSRIPTMSPALERMLEPIERDLKTGKNVSRPIRTKEGLDAFFKEL